MTGAFVPILRWKASPMRCIACVFRLILEQNLLGQNAELILYASLSGAKVGAHFQRVQVFGLFFAIVILKPK